MKKFTRIIVGAIMTVFSLFVFAQAFFVEAKEIDFSTINNKLVFHYDGDTSTFNHMWIWNKGKGGNWYDWEGEDDRGASVITYSYQEGVEVGFLVVKGEWVSKDTGADRFIDLSMFIKDSNNNYHVYLIQGDEEVYAKPGVVQPAIYAFNVLKEDNKYILYLKTNTVFKDLVIKSKDTELVTSSTIDNNSNVLLNNGKEFKFSLGEEFPDLTKTYSVTLKFDSVDENENPVEVTVEGLANTSTLYKDDSFNKAYTYDGELGAIYTKASTTFKVWSPISTEIKLRLYNNGTPKSINATLGDDTYSEYTMEKKEKGVFEAKVMGDLAGKYYTYVVTNPSYKDKEIVDPYAKSTGVNGCRGMIVDFSITNPDGWDSVKINEIPQTSLTVWETHIADLTSSKTWGGTSEYAKTYKGFYEAGTTYTKDGVTVKTGFDHVKELGVNAVQIIPVFDSDNNEEEAKRSFNWGYNPLNYNTLDGSYSLNPYDGYERIKEFKELVKAYNEAGINIIMDVVYNHVMQAQGSNFDVLMPGYYFRYTKTGEFSNGSGCGNETASEMPMFKKFMIDSTEFLATEYKLGGFRFDLMAVHDLDTMDKIATNLHSKISNNFAVYGEPWSGGTTQLNSSEAAKQDNLKDFTSYGQFNDRIRDALIKGGLNEDSSKGWVSDSVKVNKNDIESIILGLKGQTRDNVTNPSLSVQYVTCHDNYTLYDRFLALDSEEKIRSNETINRNRAMLANSVVFTSQGITFMLSGEEFLRTKRVNKNSYNASYSVNQLDYSLKIKNMDIFNNYKKLISLKQNQNVFGKTAEEIANDVKVKTNREGSVISIKIRDKKDNKEYLILHRNGVNNNGAYQVNLEGYSLYLSTLGTKEDELSENYTIKEYESLILVRELNEDSFNQEFIFIGDNAGLPTYAIVLIIVGAILLVLAATYFIVGFTAYKSGLLNQRFFEIIYKWINKK